MGKYGHVLCCGAPTRCIKHASCVCAVAARIVIQYVAAANHVVASSRLIMPLAACPARNKHIYPYGLHIIV
jgi:hypothetical protein